MAETPSSAGCHSTFRFDLQSIVLREFLMLVRIHTPENFQRTALLVLLNFLLGQCARVFDNATFIWNTSGCEMYTLLDIEYRTASIIMFGGHTSLYCFYRCRRG